MSLRVKLLAMFVAFAVVPLLAIGVFDYVRSMRALEALVVGQTSLIAERMASDVTDRWVAVQANMALVADNEETQQLLRADTADGAAIRRAADPYFGELWNAIGRDFDWISVRDARGHEVYRLGQGTGALDVTTELAGPSSYLLRVPSGENGANAAGTVVASVRLAAMLPAEALASRFGRGGYTVLVDRATGRILQGAEHADAIAPVLRDSAAARPSVTFRENDSTRLASVVRMQAPAWTAMSVATLDEFASPFASIRSMNLALVLLTTAVAAAAFLLFLWRSTRSLGILTLAADEVGRGNLEPRLPPPSRDEVGRLSAAFEMMIGRVSGTMAEIERSRQMAVVGEFASQISHEIRNPLTSIKLNLQKLQRASRRGEMPADAERPLEISLREIARLDRVVHGVLRLGRSRSTARQPVKLLDVVSQAADAARPQLESSGVALEVATSPRDDDALVLGDAGVLAGALLNLVLNAAQVSAAGDVVRLGVERVDGVARVFVRDRGPGVPPERRERIFEPFYTSKDGGTGLGLALAQRAVEEHGGTLRLEEGDANPGATFVVELPLVVPAEAGA